MGILARLGLRSPERTSVATPPSGERTLFAKDDGWYDTDAAGVTTRVGQDVYDSDTEPTGVAFPYLRVERDVDGDVQNIYLGTVD